jgi:hypothetical protein
VFDFPCFYQIFMKLAQHTKNCHWIWGSRRVAAPGPAAKMFWDHAENAGAFVKEGTAMQTVTATIAGTRGNGVLQTRI